LGLLWLVVAGGVVGVVTRDVLSEQERARLRGLGRSRGRS